MDMKIEARPWQPQDLIDDLQDLINEEPDNYLNERRKTLCMARDYLKEHFSESLWISVKDRFPDKQEYDWVLAQLKLVPEDVCGVPCVAELRCGDWYDAEGCWLRTAPEGGCVIVTHRMPLPQPPKDGDA